MEYQLDAYRPGAIASVVALHASYYGREWDFGLPFEAKVASELAEFLTRMDKERDLFLTAWGDDTLLGSITVDVTGGGEMGAHLRWFITSDAARGTGIGKILMDRAVAHIDRTAAGQCWLTTFAGLGAARALYERHGFVLARESEVDQWSGGVREQLFVRAAKRA
ncbi:MAG: GNAT family N-acetyltransferase [Mesorhizobium sp.]